MSLVGSADPSFMHEARDILWVSMVHQQALALNYAGKDEIKARHWGNGLEENLWSIKLSYFIIISQLLIFGEGQLFKKKNIVFLIRIKFQNDKNKKDNFRRFLETKAKIVILVVPFLHP